VVADCTTSYYLATGTTYAKARLFTLEEIIGMAVAHEGVDLSGDQLGSVLLVDFEFIVIAAADKILVLG
jgi:hypothetical protein